MQQIAKGLLVYELTDSPFQLSLVMFAQGFPMFLSSPIGGALADRFEQRTIIWASQAVMTMVGIALALLVLTDVVVIWHIYVLAGDQRHSLRHQRPAAPGHRVRPRRAR